MTHRLYVDESGDHGYDSLDREDRRYLGLTGLIVNIETHKFDLPDAIEGIKRRFFPHNPDDPVILHRTEIVRKTGPFHTLQDPERLKRHDLAILEMIANLPYRIISVVLDKKRHIGTYGSAALHPYHYCMTMLLERYCGYLRLWNGVGDVLCESRGGREDMQLKRAYESLFQEGSIFRSSEFFNQVLTSKQLKLRKKDANVAGLQLADLLAHPAKEDVLVEHGRKSKSGSEFRERLRQAMRPRYNRRLANGEVEGYGLILA